LRRSNPTEMDVTVTDSKTQNGMAAEAYIARLGERGIEYVFANAGTDFAPIVEALSHTGSAKVPRFMTVPHENVAMAMAHGYYRISGKPAAVMVHVTVGTANAINGIINAARDNIPVLLAAGRTPLTETGSIASRNRPIHWGQEAFDQGGMLREYVKWDYELRGGQPVAAVVDRALDIAMSEPRGPVYLTLPREVLTAPAIDARRDTVRPLGAMAPEPARAANVTPARPRLRGRQEKRTLPASRAALRWTGASGWNASAPERNTISTALGSPWSRLDATTRKRMRRPTVSNPRATGTMF